MVEWGLAATIALGAKREMTSFRSMFKETLDKLTDRVTTDGVRLATVETKIVALAAAVRELADVVEGAVVIEADEDDLELESSPTVGFHGNAAT